MTDAYSVFEEASRALEDMRRLADEAAAGGKIVDIDPKRTRKLLGDAKDKLSQIRDVREKLKRQSRRKSQPDS